jgi:hypothetical protein
MRHLVLLVVLLVATACASLKAATRDVSDVAKDMCEVVLAKRPEVLAQAKREKLSPVEVAQALCAVNDIANIFLQGAHRAGAQAVGEAHKLGKLRPTEPPAQ